MAHWKMFGMTEAEWIAELRGIEKLLVVPQDDPDRAALAPALEAVRNAQGIKLPN